MKYDANDVSELTNVRLLGGAIGEASRIVTIGAFF